MVVRYADDLLALCHTREQAEQVKARLAEWLAPRGLVFNEAKTRITHLDEGVDFLGFTIRRYPRQAADQAEQRRPCDGSGNGCPPRCRALRGANADAVIAKLNPIITGWAAYYRIGVSKRAFTALDAHVWRLVYKWARLSHPNKPRRWVDRPVLRQVQPGQAGQVGVREPGHRLLPAQVRLDTDRPAPDGRRDGVPGRPGPDRLLGPAATPQPAPAGPRHAAAAAAQHGRCPLCRGLLLHADHEPQSPQRVGTVAHGTRKAIRKHAVTADGAGTPDERVAHRLIHAHCHRRATGSGSGPSTSARPRAFRACLSRLPGKRARPVLRGPRRSNAPGLPDEARLLISPAGSPGSHACWSATSVIGVRTWIDR